jgi:gluconate 5-dehydrogenase
MGFPLFDLTGRRALVTGSSQGIGLALAEGLAEHGAEIVLNGRDPGRVAAAVDDLAARGREARASVFDVTDPTEVAEAVGALEAEGPIDILINNAGVQFRTPLEDFPIERWRMLLETNISSIFYVGQAVARGMIARGRGKIINIASVQSELARAGILPKAPYAT